MGAHYLDPVDPRGAPLPPALVDLSRWPRKPYCTDDLSEGLCIRAFRSALKRAYIQPNLPHLRVWSIYDIDRPGAALAWEDAILPPPSWVAYDPQTTRGHMAYGLAVPVLVDSPDMRQAPLRYLCAIEAGFRAKLEADQGYSGLITKNPAHERWRVLLGPQLFYDLFELAGWVDLPKHLPKRGKNPELVGLGRNCTLFDDLRQWAYRRIRQYKPQGTAGWNPWQSACYGWALQRNGDFPIPLPRSEVWHVSRSVTKWTWRRFDIAASDARFSARQAARGRKGGVASGGARLAASEDRRASARLMSAQGMTQIAIADALGVHVNTVANWLKANPQ